MPISSAEISAMQGAYLQQNVLQQQFSQQIGQGAIYGASSRGDSMMGGAMNRASSVGGPLAAGAMGLLGLDPMSLGLRSALGAYGAGAGVGGAAMVGAGVALPAMALGAAASHATSQMFVGAQQQQAMNNVLRQSFNFRNSSGGQGFDRSQMSSIGSMMREMSHQVGPGGEVASVSELTQVAGKMGQMGFAQGVRDVKEFGTRFKEMVKTLKTMAQDLGTTIEGAMEFAQAAKGSGVFGMNRIQGFTGAARSAAISGGLAMSEVTGAASIGSQISRSVGGLGRQGAMAGIRSIGQLGTAQQLGIISEEDIYNSTGLGGAEGRQAFVASQMQRTGNWLKGGRGRRMLASMAGKDGTLDEARVEQFMTGGMGIAETMSADQQQLGKVGRANFIRNEGRLRGAAMERLGMLGPAMQLQQWAQSKGIDINNMDDRSMLFAQRQFGMGRDEMDTTIKMVNDMPQIHAAQQRSASDDKYFQQLGTSRKQRGIEGVKQRFDHAKEIVNSKLQKVGQDIFNQGSEQIDEFFNKLSGTYVETYSKDVDDQYRALRGGSAAAGARAFGLGGGGVGREAQQFRGGSGIGGGGGGGMFEQMNRGSSMSFKDTLSGKGMGVNDMLLGTYLGRVGGSILGGQSDMSRLREAGFDMSKVTDDVSAQAKLNQIQSMRRAAATGFNEEHVKLGAENKWLQNAYQYGEISGKADDRIASFGRALDRRSDQEALGLKEAWAAAKTPEDKARLVAAAEQAHRVKGEGSLVDSLKTPDGLAALGQGKFASSGAENRAYAHAFGVGGSRSAKEIALAAGIATGIQTVGGAVGLGIVGTALSGYINKFASGVAGDLVGSAKEEQAAGEFLKSKEMRDLTTGLLSGDDRSRERARLELSSDISSNPSDPIISTKRNIATSASYYEAVVANRGQPLSDSQKRAWEKANHGQSAETAEKGLHAMGQILDTSQRRDMARAARRAIADSNTETDKLAGLGIYDAASGGLTAAKAEELTKLGGNAMELANLSLGQLKIERGMSGMEGGAEGDRDAMGKVQGIGESISDRLAGMSPEAKRKYAAAMAGSEGGAAAGRSAAMDKRVASLSRKHGRTGAAAQILGVEGFSKEALAGMDLTGIEGATKLLTAAGITDAGVIKEFQNKVTGSKGGLGEALRGVMETSQEFKNKKAAKDEAAAEANDPLSAAIKKNGEKTNQLMEKLVRFAGMTAEEISNIKKNDPENKGKPVGVAG